MAYKKGSENFYAEVESGVRIAFKKQWKSRNQGNNDAATAALRLWISLPGEIQALLIGCPDIDTSGIAELLRKRLREALSNNLIQKELSEQTPKDTNSVED